MSIDKEYLHNLDYVYSQLVNSNDPRKLWKTLKSKLGLWPDRILEACHPKFDPKIINLLKVRAGKIGELLILDFASESNPRASSDMEWVKETTYQLVYYGGEAAKKLAEGILESMMVGLEALSDSLRQEIIDCLCDIVDLNLGTEPKWRSYRRKEGLPLPKFFDILNGVLYSSVANFHKAIKAGEIIETHRKIIESIQCPLISVGSRKGGTGKSLFIVAIILWIQIHNPNAKICLFDLDLSGPIWQYILFPKRNEPSSFLDDEIFPYQDVRNFDFPKGFNSSIFRDLVQVAENPFGNGKKIGHLGVHDIPYINRTLDIAAELNRGEFYPFLAEVLSSISKDYDYIIMDNSPGFHSIPYSSLGIACAIENGIAFVISTPNQADLCGTFLELSEFRLTNITYPPVWIINNGTFESRRFTEKKLTALEVAQMLQAYDGALPDCPLLKKIIIPTKPCDIWKNIDFDLEVRDFGFVDAEGKPKLWDISGTKFYTDVSIILEQTRLKEWIRNRR